MEMNTEQPRQGATSSPETIAPRRGLRLRKIGNRYMIVEETEGRTDLSDVYTMNGTAAWMWETINAEAVTPDELARRMAAHYGVEQSRVDGDVRRQLREWADMGLLR